LRWYHVHTLGLFEPTKDIIFAWFLKKCTNQTAYEIHPEHFLQNICQAFRHSAGDTYCLNPVPTLTHSLQKQNRKCCGNLEEVSISQPKARLHGDCNMALNPGFHMAKAFVKQNKKNVV
jgi:hypothetical protein